MALKLNILGREVEINIGKPKAEKADEKFITEKLGSITEGKGENSLSSHFNYYFPDSEICKAETTIRGKATQYPCLNVILLDKDTNQPVKYGTVSIRTFTTPRFTYPSVETTETEQVNLFPGITPFSKSQDGIKDYIEKNFVGKVFTASKEVKVINPRFPETGGISYVNEFGGQLNQRPMNTYKEVVIEK